jgi:hypothetical protein
MERQGPQETEAVLGLAGKQAITQESSSMM